MKKKKKPSAWKAKFTIIKPMSKEVIEALCKNWLESMGLRTKGVHPKKGK